MGKTEFGRYLRELRERSRYSLRNVESYTGISNSYISMLENGKRSYPSHSMLQRLAKLYRVPMEELLSKIDGLDQILLSGKQPTLIAGSRVDELFEAIKRDSRFSIPPDWEEDKIPFFMKKFVCQMYRELERARMDMFTTKLYGPIVESDLTDE